MQEMGQQWCGGRGIVYSCIKSHFMTDIVIGTLFQILFLSVAHDHNLKSQGL